MYFEIQDPFGRWEALYEAIDKRLGEQRTPKDMANELDIIIQQYEKDENWFVGVLP